VQDRRSLAAPGGPPAEGVFSDHHELKMTAAFFNRIFLHNMSPTVFQNNAITVHVDRDSAACKCGA
jgi:hypothetical protein